MNTVGERLRDERIRLGMTQEQLATVAGVRRGAQMTYEKNERRPDTDYLAAIAAAGADVQYIVTGVRSGAMPAEPQLAPDEAAILDNYRHSPPDAQAALKAKAMRLRNRQRAASGPSAANDDV